MSSGENKNMLNFEQLLKKTWQLVMKNKKLWILGFFISSVGSFAQINREDFLEISKMSGDLLTLPENLLAGKLIIALIILLAIVAIILSIVARGSIVWGVKLARDNKPSKFWQLVRKGFSKLKDLFVMELIFLIVNIILFVPFFLSFFSGSFKVSSAVLVISIVLIVAFNLFLFLFRHYIYCYIVLENKHSVEAIKLGYSLFRKNWKQLTLAKLLEIALWIISGIIVFIAMAILFVPFLVLSAVLFVGLGPIIALVAGGVGVSILFLFFLVLRGLIGAYMSTYLTNVYIDIKK